MSSEEISTNLDAGSKWNCLLPYLTTCRTSLSARVFRRYRIRHFPGRIHVAGLIL